MNVDLTWQSGLNVTVDTQSGHTISIDGPEDKGGEKKGARPMELVLSGLVSCATMDALLMFKKSKEDVTSYKCEVKSKRADAIPAVFEDIHLHFIIEGNNLNEKRIKRALALSVDKYCSVGDMLTKGGVNITHSYELTQLSDS